MSPGDVVAGLATCSVALSILSRSGSFMPEGFLGSILIECAQCSVS